jgi:hypothetical protein
MNYPGIFKSRYSLQGKDWLRQVDPDDLRVFVDIGLQAAEHGRKGGRALVAQRGKEHMSKIGRIGAIASNIRQAWVKAAKQEAGEL